MYMYMYLYLRCKPFYVLVLCGRFSWNHSSAFSLTSENDACWSDMLVRSKQQAHKCHLYKRGDIWVLYMYISTRVRALPQSFQNSHQSRRR